MTKVYQSKSFKEFVNSSKEYQTQKHYSDTDITPKTGKMETPIEGMKTNHNVMNSAKSAVKYDPKAISFNEFTDAKRNEKMQAYSKGDKHDGSSTKKGEHIGFEKLPHAKPSKSFDIDVTKYAPRKAKG